MDELNILLNKINELDESKLKYVKNNLSSSLLNDNNNLQVDDLKIKIIENDRVNFNDINIAKKIKDIVNKLPKSLSLIEKVRYLYKKIGILFSYDYRVAYDTQFINNKKIDFENYIGNYQTCLQISYILNELLNKIDGISSKIIARKLNNMRGAYGEDHVANEVTIKIDDNTYETYLLDLTLDLYLIQSGCRTKHFGFESSTEKNYDIIPQMDNDEMDKNLGLLNNNSYLDEIIKKIKFILNNTNLENPRDYINYRLIIINSLMKKYTGYHEAKQFINLLFKELLNCNYKEFNLYKRENEEITNFKTIYKIEFQNYSKWIIYTNKLGFISIDCNIIKYLLNTDWITRSNYLIQEIESNTIQI